MKNVFCVTTIILIAGLIGFASPSLAAEMGPVLTMATPIVKMNKEAEVVMMGTGFMPNQELNILITAADGTVSNIALDIKPTPKADASGTFGCKWKPKRFLSKKLITGGAYKIEITDTDYNTIAHGVVFFTK
jgi:hypothetical protein